MTDKVDDSSTSTLTTDAPPVTRDVRSSDRPSRLYAVLGWVGIVAGVVFIAGVVFFAGFIIGKHSGPGPGHFGREDRGDHMMFHRGGPPPMGPMGPFGGPTGPGGPSGPGGPGGTQTPGNPPSPATTAVPRP